MFKIVPARAAVDVIRDGDCIGINAFLALCNPEALHRALFERVQATGHPRGLRLFCAAGFGGWDEGRFADPYIAAGAVADRERDSESYYPTMSGDIHVPPAHMDYYMSRLPASRKKTPAGGGAADIIGERAARELRPGQIVNIGIGIPEYVGKWASRQGVLRDIVTTVEAGGVGGLPAPGVSFGASIGADMVCDMASQFDFYDGAGLDICFMGGLEVDAAGNVNSHETSSGLIGIGGFANITSATKTVVFCLTFTTKGLVAGRDGGRVAIEREGGIVKFKKSIQAISFSAKNALRRGQRVLYVTERCVFELTPEGIGLKEVYDGVDREGQIAALLDFPCI